MSDATVQWESQIVRGPSCCHPRRGAHAGLTSLSSTVLSIWSRGALAVCAMNPDRWYPCKPALIGWHSLGSEHLKLFHTQTKSDRGRPGTWLLPPNAAQCGGAGASGPTCYPDHSRTRPHREKGPPGLLMLKLMLVLLLAVSAHHR